MQGNGGLFEVIHLPDLPKFERETYLVQQSLPLGQYDDAAHDRLMQAPVTMREKADRKAEIARFLVTLDGSVYWPEPVKMVSEKFGKHGTSKPRLKAILKAVEGIDPINFAPAASII